MKRLLVVYQIQDMDCLCDRAYYYYYYYQHKAAGRTTRPDIQNYYYVIFHFNHNFKIDDFAAFSFEFDSSLLTALYSRCVRVSLLQQ